MSASPPPLWLIAPASAKRFARQSTEPGLAWCYLGTNIETQARVAAQLSPAVRVSIGEELTRIAHELKQPFLDWVAQVGARQRDPVRWWGSTLASSSPLQTDTFLLVCYTRLVQRWLDSPPMSRLRLVVVEDPWLRLTLRRQLAGDPRVAIVGGGLGGCFWDAVAWLWHIPGVLLSTATSALLAWVVAAWSFRRQTAFLRAGSQDAVVLCTWVRPQCFSTPGCFTDPWLGRLEQLLSAQGAQVSRLGSLTLSVRLLRQLKRVAPACLVTTTALRLGDIARSVGRWFCLDGFGQLPACLGWDYRPLVAREIFREWGQANFAYYRLGYFATRRMARRIGPRVKCVIYPFENQPWEKLFCLAWRREAPHVKLVGYQHSWVPSLLLPYALGRGEAERSPLPDHIVANSAYSLQALQDGGYPRAKLVNGGALRHEYLYAKIDGTLPPSISSARPSRDRRRRAVLVTFPLLRPHASRLFMDLVEEFRTPLVMPGAAENPVAFLLKCHPNLRLEQCYKGRLRLPSWMTFTDVPVEELLPNVDLFLYAPSTSSWWVAFLHGVPVLKYQTDLLDIDIELAGVQVQTCSREGLRSAIERLLGDGSPKQRLDPIILERMFGRVNEQVWAAVGIHESV